MQLFVSDKLFVKFYDIKIKAQFPQVLSSFTKEVDVPNAFIIDPSGDQALAVVRAFCHNISTTLRILEESTQHTDCAELYIGLLK